MTGDILDQVLSKLNRTLWANGRSVLDNVTQKSCSTSTQTSRFCFYQLIRHQFFSHWIWESPKTSSCGIYRKLLFQHVLAKTEDCTTASEVTKSHTILKQELSDLIAKLQHVDDACEVSDLTSAENNIPVCEPASKLTHPDDYSDEDSDDEDAVPMEVPPPRLKSLDKAITCPEDIFGIQRLYQRSKLLIILSWMI